MKRQVIISFILGALIFSGITGVLAYKLGANQVSYTPEDSNWNVSDVDTALDDLYDMATYGDAQASDIKSGKTALVNGNQVTGSLTIPNYTTLANTENIGAGSSSSARTGYYYLDNYKVTCGTTTCPSYTSLSGTTNINPGGSSTTLNGYYNMSNYKVSCSGCAVYNTSIILTESSISFANGNYVRGLNTWTINKTANNINPSARVRYVGIYFYTNTSRTSGTIYYFFIDPALSTKSAYLVSSSNNGYLNKDLAYPATSNNRLGISETDTSLNISFYETASKDSEISNRGITIILSW